MKKLRFFAPVMATVAALTPATALLSSCGKINYTEIVSEIKDEAMSIFMEIAKTTHRASWDEGEVFDYIFTTMSKLKIDAAGQDNWTAIPEVRAKIISEMETKYPGRPVPDKPVGKKIFSEYGNIWYDIPASEGMENVPKLIITGHMDCSMAFNSNADKEKWIAATEDIINVTYDNDNEILKTDKKTSLGADDGLGIAVMLSLAKKKDSFKHGEIRLIFTAGESEATENYASGSDFLYNDQICGGKPTNKDKEITSDTSYLEEGSKKPFGEKGEYPYIISTSGIYKNCVYSSTAGIHDCEIADYSNLVLNHEDDDFTLSNKIDWKGENLNLYTIHLDNLKGGQSGKNINSGYASALQMLMQMLFTGDYHMRLISAYSEPGTRAIPTQAEATFACSKSKEEIEAKMDLIIEKYKACYPNDDWTNFTHTLTQHKDTEKSNYTWSFSPKQSRAITKLMGFELLYGPVDYFDAEHTKVKTSCNFCDLKMEANQNPDLTSYFHMHNVCRSADVDTLYYFHYTAAEVLYDAFEWLYEFNPDPEKPAKEGHSSAWWTAKSKSTHLTKPVWEKSDDDKMVKLACDGFNNLGISPITWENHGWVDIATVPLIYETAFETEPQITCLGPEIRQSHEVDEEVWTDTLTTCLGSLMYVIDHMKNI